MKTASPALIAFLEAARLNPDAKLLMADGYLITLESGLTLAYSSIDLPFTINGVAFRADGPKPTGLKYRAGINLDFDEQELTIGYLDTDLVAGVPFALALAERVFDGATLQRTRVFFADRLGGAIVGAVTLFKGRIGDITSIGRIQAKMKVNSDLIFLDTDMPKALFQATCLWTLYGVGCNLDAADFSFPGVAGAGSTVSTIAWTGADARMAQGRIRFTSGANAGVSTTIRSVAAGASLTLVRPLYRAPAVGDAFIAAWGCDHTCGTCANIFDNLDNFIGFPFIPPPEEAV